MPSRHSSSRGSERRSTRTRTRTLTRTRTHTLTQARLSKAEVGALRLYTSSTFRIINGPLRSQIQPHPLAFTTFMISQASHPPDGAVMTP